MEKSGLGAVSGLAVLLAFAVPARRPAGPGGNGVAVNAFTTGAQRVPRLAIVPGGGSSSLAQRRTTETATPSTAAATTPRGRRSASSSRSTPTRRVRHTLPIVTADRSGNFVVVWMSDGQDGDLYGIFGQRYDAAGDRAGCRVRRSTPSRRRTRSRATPASTLRAGFTVAWTSTGSEDGDGASVQCPAVRSPAAHALGAEFVRELVRRRATRSVPPSRCARTAPSWSSGPPPTAPVYGDRRPALRRATAPSWAASSS